VRKQLIIFNVLAITFFFSCWLLLGFDLSDAAMFQTPDAQSYLEVSNWIFKGEQTISTSIRPVLYPAILGSAYFIFGHIGVWALQFILWMLTLNITFKTVVNWSGSPKIAWVSAIVLMVNLSLMAHTFQGLTEVLTAALLSLLFYHVVNYSGKYNQPVFGLKLLLIFVSLTLVKPVFFYPTVLCLILTLFAYGKVYLSSLKKLLYLILIIVPILLQMTLVQAKHGSFQVSQIAGITFDNYYFAQCVRGIEGIEDERESKEFVSQMSSDEKMDYLLQNKGTFVKQFAENVVMNLKATSDLLDKQFVNHSRIAFGYMKYYNFLGLLINVLGAILLASLIMVAFFKRKRQEWIPLFIIGGLLNYFLFTTGISFWQGDRLVLPAIALWIPLYAVLFYRLVAIILRKFSR